MPFINVNGIQLYYEIDGEGPPLLIISGTGADLAKPETGLSDFKWFPSITL